MNAIHPAIVGNGLCGNSKRQTRAVGYDIHTGQTDSVLIEDAARDRAHAAHPQLREHVGIARYLKRYSVAARQPLAVRCREVVIPNCRQQVHTLGNGGEHEMTRASGSSDQWLGMGAG